MTSIHDSFDLIKKIAEYRTTAEVQALGRDDDEAREWHEADMQEIQDSMDTVIAEARKLVADRPFDYIDFSGAAIREHYENYDQDEEIEGLSDQDLQDVGEWALNSDSIWESVYYAWDYGIAQVRSEKQKREI